MRVLLEAGVKLFQGSTEIGGHGHAQGLLRPQGAGKKQQQ
jgi:hypothetical protein